MLQISLSSLDEDKYYEWKKVKKACKKVKSIVAWMLSKSSMSAKLSSHLGKTCWKFVIKSNNKCSLQRPLQGAV